VFLPSSDTYLFPLLFRIWFFPSSTLYSRLPTGGRALIVCIASSSAAQLPSPHAVCEPDCCLYMRGAVFSYSSLIYPFYSSLWASVVTLLYVNCIWEWWAGELRLEGGRQKDRGSGNESGGLYSFYYLVRSTLVLVPISDEFIAARIRSFSLNDSVRKDSRRRRNGLVSGSALEGCDRLNQVALQTSCPQKLSRSCSFPSSTNPYFRI